MELTLERPGDHLFIRSVSEKGLQIIDRYYSGPIILSPREVITGWPVNTVEDLDESQLDKILTLDPEIVLLGTGSRQVFLPPQMMMSFYSRNVGIEVMSTDAAARTFNVLVSESRKVIAALMPIETL